MIKIITTLALFCCLSSTLTSTTDLSSLTDEPYIGWELCPGFEDQEYVDIQSVTAVPIPQVGTATTVTLKLNVKKSVVLTQVYSLVKYGVIKMWEGTQTMDMPFTAGDVIDREIPVPSKFIPSGRYDATLRGFDQNGKQFLCYNVWFVVRRKPN